ncbi:PRC-barrel domain-containing protein [Leptolyngbya sp. FACHB-36]|uniref:PRC-barrel domain-containing protein n=1 Tax=Leptolyngbya sp. FACHB-36 TaxID=2692808 RepID=UPI00168052C0|nr:PRC-barrel domain-containing protein [Leptolyngbya sp. FACHB-36]MBD2020564.1 PRC-barrel domain-containing protein [Leptolyngbya sp. FACHB-36]
MALYKINDFKPLYRTSLTNYPTNNKVLQTFEVYRDRHEKLGEVADGLVGEDGTLRYLVVNVNSWLSGKRVIVPLTHTNFDLHNQRVYVHGLTRTHANDLPTYYNDTIVDDLYEAQVNTVFRTHHVEERVPVAAAPSQYATTVHAPVTQAPPAPPPNPGLATQRRPVIVREEVIPVQRRVSDRHSRGGDIVEPVSEQPKQLADANASYGDTTALEETRAIKFFPQQIKPRERRSSNHL